jgi:glutamate synthase (NADPH) large chain
MRGPAGGRSTRERNHQKRYIKAIDKGMLKVMSKMGISTYQSYCGAQIFDAVGLKRGFVDEYFTGTATRIEGVGLKRSPRRRAPPPRRLRRRADLSRRARCRRRIRLPHARRGPRLDAGNRSPSCSTRCAAIRARIRAFAKRINEQSERLLTLRGLFRDQARRDAAVPLEEVEPAPIVKRFATGAMSLRLDLARGAHHAGDRDEPHRRQVEHRRGRRGIRPLQAAAERRFDALGDQAGGLGPLRRDRGIPGQRRR